MAAAGRGYSCIPQYMPLAAGRICRARAATSGSSSRKMDDEDAAAMVLADPCAAFAVGMEVEPLFEKEEEEEVEFVGSTSGTKLPHFSQDCTEGGSCELCYCYVCDAPCRECISWVGDHAHAAADGGKWDALRKSRREASAADPNRKAASTRETATPVAKKRKAPLTVPETATPVAKKRKAPLTVLETATPAAKKRKAPPPSRGPEHREEPT